jgi:ribosome biogenesis protein MAK21
MVYQADCFLQHTLSKDVSKFIKELNFAGSGPHESENPRKPVDKHKTRPQKGLGQLPENETRAPEKPSKKQKKGSPQKAVKSTPQKTEPPVDDASRVQLPTKVTFNARSHFVFQPISQWYTAINPLTPPTASTSAISPSQLASSSSKAAELHAADMRTFQSSSSSNSASSEANFLFKIIQSGTLSDRLSALTLLVQSSPLHNTKALETLKGMAERGKGKGGREESLKALRCIVDWWVGGGAPDRKLK